MEEYGRVRHSLLHTTRVQSTRRASCFCLCSWVFCQGNWKIDRVSMNNVLCMYTHTAVPYIYVHTHHCPIYLRTHKPLSHIFTYMYTQTAVPPNLHCCVCARHGETSSMFTLFGIFRLSSHYGFCAHKNACCYGYSLTIEWASMSLTSHYNHGGLVRSDKYNKLMQFQVLLQLSTERDISQVRNICKENMMHISSSPVTKTFSTLPDVNHM